MNGQLAVGQYLSDGWRSSQGWSGVDPERPLVGLGRGLCGGEVEGRIVFGILHQTVGKAGDSIGQGFGQAIGSVKREQL